jgi:hypothetical protein
MGAIGLLLAGMAIGAHANAAEACDRACLEGFVNQYLSALVAQDPSKLYFADPQAGHVGFFGTIEEPIFHQALTPLERRPRAELIRVANTYFEGMEAGTDKNTPFDKDCQRSDPFRSFGEEQNHHLFKVSDGKIKRIEALVTPVPYGMYTGWPAKR